MADSEGPKRIQRKRTRGFRLPPNTVCVDRTSRYGNPYKVQRHFERGHVMWVVRGLGATFGPYATEGFARRVAVDQYRAITPSPVTLADLTRIAEADFVACFCDPDDGMACHGDVLIEAAMERSRG